jgi:ABC-type multidrug transport system fused ATPase/permease subunit
VIVLDSGQIAAAGNPEELEQSNAFFRQLAQEG